MSLRWTKLLFAAAALYDGGLGLAFFFWSGRLFAAFGVTPPTTPATCSSPPCCW